MKIALINGSPKINKSASGSLLNDLKYYISEEAEVAETGLHNTVVPKAISEELADSDALVFSCPLYVDGIPAHLLSCLIQLEKAHWPEHKIYVYGIVNCGFYEGIQTRFALKILQNWCKKAGFVWGGGVGVGGGGGLAYMPDLKRGQGPKAPIHRALEALAHKILKNEIQENKYVSVGFPRLLYKAAAQTVWRRQIKANGGRPEDLGKRPE